MDYAELAFKEIRRSLEAQRVRIAKIEESVSDREASGFPSVVYADLQYSADGMSQFSARFVSNGRKAGEGVGVGTGVPAWYDPSSDAWLTFSLDTAVTV